MRLTPEQRLTVLRVLSLLAVIGLSLWIFSIRDKAEEWAALGYPGIFLVAMMANATVLLPAPGVALVFGMGAILNPLWVGIAAGIGGGLGELSGYLMGFSGQAVVERTGIYERFHNWMERYGAWAVFALSAVPNPFFDIAGVAAGILKMPLPLFLIACIAGQIVKMLLFAYAGALSLDWVIQWSQ